MRLLLDECVPRRLKRDFKGHLVTTIDEAGFKGLKNGKLLRSACALFDVLVTVDKNIEHQQNKAELTMAILILSASSNRYESILPLIPKALEALIEINKTEIIKIEV